MTDSDKMELRPGTMFVASPFLTEHKYKFSVIYIVDADDDFVQAITLNRPSTMSVDNAVDHEHIPWSMDLYIGGLEDWQTVLYLHVSDIHGSVPVVGRVRIGGDLAELYDNVQIYRRQPTDKLKFFAGHIRMTTDDFLFMWANKLWIRCPMSDPFETYYWEDTLASCGDNFEVIATAGYKPN